MEVKGSSGHGICYGCGFEEKYHGVSNLFCEALIAWNSRLQKNLTLSSMESTYVELSEISTEILFVHDVLVFMGI